MFKTLRWSSGLGDCYQESHRFESQTCRSLWWYKAARCQPACYCTWPIESLFDSMPLQVSGTSLPVLPRVVGPSGYGSYNFHYLMHKVRNKKLLGKWFTTVSKFNSSIWITEALSLLLGITSEWVTLTENAFYKTHFNASWTAGIPVIMSNLCQVCSQTIVPHGHICWLILECAPSVRFLSGNLETTVHTSDFMNGERNSAQFRVILI